MTDVITTLAQVAPRYRALFCDLWGCVHNGIAAFPAAVAALQGFRASGGRVILLTNAPRPNAAVIHGFARLGLPENAWDAVVSSGDAAQYGLLQGAVGHKVYHIGPEKDHSFFTDFSADMADLATVQPAIDRVPLDQAEGIVCTGPFNEMTETPEDYRATLLVAKARGLKLLCTNPDLVVDVGHQRIYCAGAIAQAYDEMGGTSLYFGKPHPPIYDLARRRLAAFDPTITDAEILCLGDGVGTDVKGGLAEGLDTVFITGGLAASEFGPDVENPDPALLSAWLAGRQMAPAYAMGFLR